MDVLNELRKERAENRIYRAAFKLIAESGIGKDDGDYLRGIIDAASYIGEEIASQIEEEA